MPSYGLIPVVEIEASDHAIPLANALITGGLPIIEITPRTDAGLGSIRKIARDVPDVIIGRSRYIPHPLVARCR